MAMLGVGRPEVYVTERGGGPIIGELTDITRLLWDRRRDEISQCIVEMRALSPKCCEIINRVQAVRHELVVHRDGRRVWEGPITLMKFEQDSVLIEARDVLWYADRFVLPKYDCTYDEDKRPRGCNVLELVDRMLRTTYKDRVYTSGGTTFPLPKYNVEHTVYIKDGKITTEPKQEEDPRTTIKVSKNTRTCFEVLDNLASGAGIDYTVLGRQVLVWDTNFMPRQLPQMVQSHFQGPINLGEYGQRLITRRFRSNNQLKWVKAEAPAKYIKYYGFIDQAGSNIDLDAEDDDENESDDIVTDDGDESSEKLARKRADLIASAKRSLQYPVPRHIQIPENTVLDPCLPVAINQLVPGSYAEVRFEHPCREVSEFQKLDVLTVEYVDGGEQVRVNMGPAPQNLYRRKPGT